MAAILAVPASGADTSPKPGSAMRVALAAWGLSFVWLGVAYLRQRLIADSIGVRVRNPLSSFSMRWDEIDRFEPPPPLFSRQGLGRRYGLAVVTTDGRRLRTLGPDPHRHAWLRGWRRRRTFRTEARYDPSGQRGAG